MTQLWKQIDAIDLPSFGHLKSDDVCYYARNFVRNAGFDGGETNSLVLNFKKEPGRQGQTYRQNAVDRFIEEVSVLIQCKADTVAVTAIPSSKSKTDSAYDNRFEDMFAGLKKIRSCLQIEWPIIAKESVLASHLGGARTPSQIISNYEWKGFVDAVPDFILIFDDVLTTGAHFRAFSDFMRGNGFSGQIYGIFWAKSTN